MKAQDIINKSIRLENSEVIGFPNDFIQVKYDVNHF